jgi:hypothetical protein
MLTSRQTLCLEMLWLSLAASPRLPEAPDVSLLSSFRTVTLPDGSWRSPADPTQPAMFGPAPEVFISRGPLLMPVRCAQYTFAANTWATRRGGWGMRRAPLAELPDLQPDLKRLLDEMVLPALRARYPAAADNEARLRLMDASVQRYVPGTEPPPPPAPPGADQVLLAVNVALNDPAEYTGGGTHFDTLGLPLDASASGQAVLFPAGVAHAPAPLVRGTRYVLSLLVTVSAARAGEPRGKVEHSEL